MSSSASQHPQLSTKDFEHLQLLSIFHWVYAGLTALCGCLPIVHVAMGAAMVAAPDSMDSNNPPPAWMGGMFVAIGLGAMLAMWAIAAAVAWAGKCLRECRSRTYCIVVAAIACLNVPLGTILGVLTIMVLMREDVKKAFGD